MIKRKLMTVHLSRFALVTGFFLLAVCGYLAVSTAGDGKISEESIHRPGPLPDRIILTWAGDPATSQSVTWRTDTTVRTAMAQIAVAGDGPDFTKQAESIGATSRLLESDLNEALYHTSHFTGLKPKTLYAYRVGDGSNWSEWNQFRTASDAPEPMTFIYVGDAQNRIYEHWSRLIRMGFTEAPRANFLLHAGDLVNRANRDAEWGEWFRSAGWINRSVPSIPTPGNHEYDKGEDGKRALTRHWRTQFALPDHGPAGLEESCYYVDIQGVRIVSLNSNEMREEQALWLDNLLADNPNRWTILTFHHPVYSSARARDNKELRETWKPVFDKYAVDLVLTGHDHSYARSNLMSGINTRSDVGGTVYVVSVSGPKQYEVDRRGWMERAAEHAQLYQVIHIDGNKLRYQAHTATGRPYDAFELQKRTDGRNELINRVPSIPERLALSGG